MKLSSRSSGSQIVRARVNVHSIGLLGSLLGMDKFGVQSPNVEEQKFANEQNEAWPGQNWSWHIGPRDFCMWRTKIANGLNEA